MQEFATRCVARVGLGTDGTPIAAYGNGRIVVRVSSSSPVELMVSSDLGLSWQSVTLPNALGFGYVEALSFDGEVFVLSNLYQVPSYIPMVATSADGVNWQFAMFEVSAGYYGYYTVPGLRQSYPNHYGSDSSLSISAFDGFWMTQARRVVNDVGADFDIFISFNRGAQWQLVAPPPSVPQRERNIGASFGSLYTAYGAGFSVVQLAWDGDLTSFYEDFAGLLVNPAAREIKWVPQKSPGEPDSRRGWFADRLASELVTIDGYRLSASGVWRDDESVRALSGGLDRDSSNLVIDSRKQGSGLTTFFSNSPRTIGIQQFNANTGWHAIDGVRFVRPDPLDDALERVDSPNYPSVADALASVSGVTAGPNSCVIALDDLWVHLAPATSDGGYLVFHTVALSKSQFWTNKVGTHEA